MENIFNLEERQGVLKLININASELRTMRYMFNK